MKEILHPWIVLKETIHQKDYERINQLQEICVREDQIALKLELEYKLANSMEKNTGGISNINHFLYFAEDELVGYIGIDSFGGTGDPLEANGMVHPKHRRQGVFKRLSELAVAEWKRRNSGSMLLLCDRKSFNGQSFIKTTGAQCHHTEYEMYLKDDLKPQKPSRITLRKVTDADALEEKGGMQSFLAEKDHEGIGQVHLQMTPKFGGIFGLIVQPENRGKGFGRAILMMAIEKLKEAGAGEIMLQVDAENTTAMNLYKSCGFQETSTMDYYELVPESII